MNKGDMRKIALVGNPNSGKSSLFNHLTGLNQKVGNFPGVTVDKKTGYTTLHNGEKVEIIDLPGTYSIYPNSKDERIVFDILCNATHPQHPDAVIVIVDASNFKRNLLLFTQIRDLNIPCVLVLNMMDIVERTGLYIDALALSDQLGVEVVPMRARSGHGVVELKSALESMRFDQVDLIYNPESDSKELIDRVKSEFGINETYQAYQLVQQKRINRFLSHNELEKLDVLEAQYGFERDELRRKETLERYDAINKFIEDAIKENPAKLSKRYTRKLDRILTHKFWGYAIFFAVLFVIFQAIFAWASVPMDFIDLVFSEVGGYLSNKLPAGVLTDLLTEGVIPGIGGVVIFIPQIAMLFAFISILEESGYMSRVVFLMDKIMRKVGLNGRSVVPLISGVACAIPAIMATRTIENWKERLITIFVTPFMSCSARLPVYTILIAVVVPDNYLFGFLSVQALVMMGLYLLGFILAIASAWIMQFILKTNERSYLVMELPTYKMPRWANVGMTMLEKSKTFVFEAGKIILAISVILWVLASFGPADRIEKGVAEITASAGDLPMEDKELKIQAYKLENSYAGIFGKAIEPAIKPLGYDWKIGIALITSFAAREVFVSTMATIYSIDGEEDTTIKNRLKSEINPDTGEPLYNLATGMSLLVFYVFAMQCMSTLAVVYRETKGWHWPAIQLVYMSAVAYVSAWATFTILS